MTALALLLIGFSAALTSHAQAAICLDCAPEEEVEEPPPPPPPRPTPTPTPAPSAYKVLVVNVGWGNGEHVGDSPLVPSLLNEYQTYLSGHATEWFAQQAPPGSVEQRWEYTPGGSYTIPRPTLPSNPFDCSDDQRHTFFANLIFNTQFKLQAQGIDYSKYNFVIMATSHGGYCGSSGIQDSNRIWLSNKQDAMHEIGHFLGLGHGNGLRCQENGTLVPLSNSCEPIEYADVYTTMGGAFDFSFNAPETNRLGWMAGQFVDVKAPEVGTYTLNSFTDPSHSARAIRLKDGATTLWIELWGRTGVNGPDFKPEPELGGNLPEGLLIHRETGNNTSQLLDMTPIDGSLEFLRPVLPEGQTWANPLGETTITLEHETLSPLTAVVKIGTQLTQTTPNVIGMGLIRATAVAEAAGLTPAGFEGRPDDYCNNIGLVMEQRPFPGEKVRPGSPMRFIIGEAPTHECF